jgi:hypothetical protein
LFASLAACRVSVARSARFLLVWFARDICLLAGALDFDSRSRSRRRRACILHTITIMYYVYIIWLNICFSLLVLVSVPSFVFPVCPFGLAAALGA